MFLLCGGHAWSWYWMVCLVLAECASYGLRVSLQQGHELMALERQRERERLFVTIYSFILDIHYTNTRVYFILSVTVVSHELLLGRKKMQASNLEWKLSFQLYKTGCIRHPRKQHLLLVHFVEDVTNIQIYLLGGWLLSIVCVLVHVQPARTFAICCHPARCQLQTNAGELPNQAVEKPPSEASTQRRPKAPRLAMVPLEGWKILKVLKMTWFPLDESKWFCYFLESKQGERGELISGGLIILHPIQWIVYIMQQMLEGPQFYLALCIVGCASYSSTTFMLLYLRRSWWVVCQALWISMCVCQVRNVFQSKSTECFHVSFCVDFDYYLDVSES